MAPIPSSTLAPSTTKPKRVNNCIELLEQGQPVYCTLAKGGYEDGKRMALTSYDMVVYEMEHAPLNILGLQEFMRGLVDGGPTKSGHRTPTAVPQLPVAGWDEATMQANYWMCHQVLDTGAHGVYLCHAGEHAPQLILTTHHAAREPPAQNPCHGYRLAVLCTYTKVPCSSGQIGGLVHGNTNNPLEVGIVGRQK